MKKSKIVTVCFSTMLAATFLFTACGGSDESDKKEESVSTTATVTVTGESTAESNDTSAGYVNQGNGDNYAVDIFTDEAVENQDNDYEVITHKKGEVVTDKNHQPVTNSNGEKQTYSGKEKETIKINKETEKKPNKNNTKPQNDNKEETSNDGVWTDFY